MELGEIFPAVQSAKRSVHIKPDWGVAHQTLGRAYLNIGELSLVCQSFHLFGKENHVSYPRSKPG